MKGQDLQRSCPFRDSAAFSSYFVTTGIGRFFACASSAFGMCTVRMPSFMSAVILPSSTPPGNGKERWNEPKRPPSEVVSKR